MRQWNDDRRLKWDAEGLGKELQQLVFAVHMLVCDPLHAFRHAQDESEEPLSPLYGILRDLQPLCEQGQTLVHIREASSPACVAIGTPTPFVIGRCP